MSYHHLSYLPTRSHPPNTRRTPTHQLAPALVSSTPPTKPSSISFAPSFAPSAPQPWVFPLLSSYHPPPPTPPPAPPPPTALPSSTLLIPLPSHLTRDFSQWATSTIPWLQRFTTLHPPPHPPIAMNDPYPLSVVQHHESGENKKFVGRSRPNIPAGQVTTAILDNGYCLIPCTFDPPGGQLGPFFNSIFWPHGSQPTATLPLLSTTSSLRSLSNDPARRAATLAYDLCPDLGILTKAVVLGARPEAPPGTPAITLPPSLATSLNKPWATTCF
jgi:hypothetical protein